MYSTSADVLEQLDHPVIEPILRYRKLTKLQSVYIEGLSKLVDKTGRVHTTFDQTAAVTGRISSLEPNLQNIPVRSEEGREIRKAFIAKEDWQLLDADYSQIELRGAGAYERRSRHEGRVYQGAGHPHAHGRRGKQRAV